jgi:hypothetical protein
MLSVSQRHVLAAAVVMLLCSVGCSAAAPAVALGALSTNQLDITETKSIVAAMECCTQQLMLAASYKKTAPPTVAAAETKAQVAKPAMLTKPNVLAYCAGVAAAVARLLCWPMVT